MAGNDKDFLEWISDVLGPILDRLDEWQLASVIIVGFVCMTIYAMFRIERSDRKVEQGEQATYRAVELMVTNVNQPLERIELGVREVAGSASNLASSVSVMNKEMSGVKVALEQVVRALAKLATT